MYIVLVLYNKRYYYFVIIIIIILIIFWMPVFCVLIYSVYYQELCESISSEKFKTVPISKASANKIPKIVNLHKQIVEWQKITLHHYWSNKLLTFYVPLIESALKEF